MGQTDYSLNPAEGFAGMIADSSDTRIKSASAEVEVAFGLGVVAGTDAEKQVALPTADTDVFRGIAVQTHKGGADGEYVAKYEVKDALGYLTKGTVWVDANVAVSVDEPAYLIASGADAGKFTNVSTGNIATGGKFTKTIAGAGLSVIEINLP